MPNMRAPEIADRFSNAEKAALVEAGIGYFNGDRIDQVAIGRAATTYTVADDGTLDETEDNPAFQEFLAALTDWVGDKEDYGFVKMDWAQRGWQETVLQRRIGHNVFANYMVFSFWESPWASASIEEVRQKGPNAFIAHHIVVVAP